LFLGLGAAEVVTAVVSVLTLWRRYPAAIVATWVIFALHIAASGAAALFAFTFKINRLI
jgi:hypothetical protein